MSRQGASKSLDGSWSSHVGNNGGGQFIQERGWLWFREGAVQMIEGLQGCPRNLAQSFVYCVFCACMCARVCMCVHMGERGREKKREGE